MILILHLFVALYSTSTIRLSRISQIRLIERFADLALRFEENSSNFEKMVKLEVVGDYDEVKVKGSWDQWQEEILLKKEGELFTIDIELSPGPSEFKFICDGEWRTFDDFDKTANVDGIENNVLLVEEPVRKVVNDVEDKTHEKLEASVEELIGQFDAIEVNAVTLEKQDSLLADKYRLNLTQTGAKEDLSNISKEGEKEGKSKKSRWRKIFHK